MAVLIDTHVILWFELNESLISRTAMELILNDDEVYFSKASIWEIAIKIQTGKLDIKKPLDKFLTDFIEDNNFKMMDIQLPHIYKTQEFDLFHRDPFDRLIIAQSIVEKIPIISSDAVFDAYPIKRIWS